MIPNDETLPAKIIPQTNRHHHCKGYDTSKRRRQNFFDLTTDTLHLPSDGYHFLALTLFTTLKGWGTGVSHLAGFAS